MESGKYLLIIFILSLCSSVSAIDVTTGSSCTENEPLISLNNSEGGHVAEYSYDYPHKICVETDELNLRQSCNGDENILFTMDRKNNSHLSIFENKYNYEMCSENLNASIVSDRSCINGTKVASVAKKDNTHAAYPSYQEDPFNQSLCLTRSNVDSVTVSLSGVSSPIYASGKNIQKSKTMGPPVKYPYIATSQPIGIVSYGKFLELSYPSEKTISLTQQDGSFLLPFSKGGYRNIEDKQRGVNRREFLDRHSPNFFLPKSGEKPKIMVIYRSENKLEAEREDLREKGEIQIRNKGIDDSLNPQIVISVQ